MLQTFQNMPSRLGAVHVGVVALDPSIPTDRVFVPRLWPDSTVVCLGTGPSLTDDDVNACRGRARVIAVNDAYRLAPWADVLYACDAKWWRYHKSVPSFTGLKFALEDCEWQAGASSPGVQVLENTGEFGIELAPTGLRTGRNSGAQAINVAVHLGAARVILLGYDMGYVKGQPSHFFGEHPKSIAGGPSYASFIPGFARMVKPLAQLGVEVINCSRRTALTTFPCRPLESVL